jgi:hypothetical protein
MVLFLKKPPNIFFPNKATNIYKNTTASIFTKILPHFFAIIYKNTIGYEKNNKATVTEH